MYLRSAAALLILATTGCNVRPVGLATAHVEVAPDANGRNQLNSIGQRLKGFSPVILLDEETRIANVAASRGATFKVIEEAARSAGLRASQGFEKPSTAFVKQTQCSERAPCDVEQHTVCAFRAEVSDIDFSKHFQTFAERLGYGGYAVLGVLYERIPGSKRVTLRVPMYDQCSVAADQLQKAWRHVSPQGATSFYQEIPGQ